MAKERKRYEDLDQTVKDLVLNAGAIDVGIVTTETLEGGPPSADLSYVLDGARSAIVFALPLDQEKIERFLKKEDFSGHALDNVRTNTQASGIALELARFLEIKGHSSVSGRIKTSSIGKTHQGDRLTKNPRFPIATSPCAPV